MPQAYVFCHLEILTGVHRAFFTVRILYTFEVSKLSGERQSKTFAIIFLNHLSCAKHFKTASCNKSSKYQGTSSLMGNLESFQAPCEPNIVNEQALEYSSSCPLNMHCNEWIFSRHAREILASICLLNIWPYYYWYGSNMLPANFSFKGCKVHFTYINVPVLHTGRVIWLHQELEWKE